MQIAGQKTCLPGEGIFKSVARCCKTMLLVERGLSDSSRKQAWKSPGRLRPDFTDLGADTLLPICPLPTGKNELWSQQCFPQKLRERCRVQENLLWSPPWSRRWGGGLPSCPTACFPTVALHRSPRVCLEDSAAYTCSFTVNNCINFIGSPGLNRLRFM